MGLEIEVFPHEEDRAAFHEALSSVLDAPLHFREFPLLAFRVGRRGDGTWNPVLELEGHVYVTVPGEASDLADPSLVLHDREARTAAFLPGGAALASVFFEALEWTLSRDRPAPLRVLLLPGDSVAFWCPEEAGDDRFFARPGGGEHGASFARFLRGAVGVTVS